ncbi:MAG: IS21 family transposase [Dehalococcoidia bacterium]
MEGKSIRQIAREWHHDRRTIRAAIKDASPPQYKMSKPRSMPVLGRFVAVIDKWLADDEFQPTKQRHTSRRIYHRLIEEHGYSGGESTVREYVHKHRDRQRPVFIPLTYEPGVDAQVDFGEARVMMRGRPLTVQFFVGRLCFSKIPFLKASLNQQQEALFEGHEEAFNFFGGVPRTIWYDRLSQAVRCALPGHKPLEQEAFIAFRSHYLFESHFCNPREAHEKGLVENLVGYARRNFLVPVPGVDSFQELNDLLMQRCLTEVGRRLRGENQTIGELWGQERPHLLPLPTHPFPCCRTVPVHPNRLSMVTFQTNRYSVPVEHVSESLLLRAFVDRVEITDGTEVIAAHKRFYEREQNILNVFHYLPLLKQRPGAFDHAKPLKTWDHSAILDRYLAQLRERLSHRMATVEFLRVMELCLEHPLGEVAAAVEQAMILGSLGISTIAFLLRASQTSFQPLPTGILTSAPVCPPVQGRDLRQYDCFIRR